MFKNQVILIILGFSLFISFNASPVLAQTAEDVGECESGPETICLYVNELSSLQQQLQALKDSNRVQRQLINEMNNKISLLEQQSRIDSTLISKLERKNELTQDLVEIKDEQIKLKVERIKLKDERLEIAQERIELRDEKIQELQGNKFWRKIKNYLYLAGGLVVGFFLGGI